MADWWAEQEIFGADVDETGVPVTTTDTDALAERIARALRQATDEGADRTEDYAAAVLPIVEASVASRKCPNCGCDQVE